MERTALPKPYKGELRLLKARKHRRECELRDACRAFVYNRDGGCCVRCGKPLKLKLADASGWWDVANINEKRPRSLGGDPTDPENCETLCAGCHTGQGYHAK